MACCGQYLKCNKQIRMIPFYMLLIFALFQGFSNALLLAKEPGEVNLYDTDKDKWQTYLAEKEKFRGLGSRVTDEERRRIYLSERKKQLVSLLISIGIITTLAVVLVAWLDKLSESKKRIPNVDRLDTSTTYKEPQGSGVENRVDNQVKEKDQEAERHKAEQCQLADQLICKDAWRKVSVIDRSELIDLLMDEDDKGALESILDKICNGKESRPLEHLSADIVANKLTGSQIKELGRLTDRIERHKLADQLVREGAWSKVSVIDRSELRNLLTDEDDKKVLKSILDTICNGEESRPLGCVIPDTIARKLTKEQIRELDRLASVIAGAYDSKEKERRRRAGKPKESSEPPKSIVPPKRIAPPKSIVLNQDEQECCICSHEYEDGQVVVSACSNAAHHTCQECLKSLKGQYGVCQNCQNPLTNSVFYMKFNKAQGTLEPESAEGVAN